MPSRGLEMTAVFKTIGIVGAGQMGCGIAQVSAGAGYRVHIYDLSQDRIEAALATINGNLARHVTSGKMTDEERADPSADFRLLRRQRSGLLRSGDRGRDRRRKRQAQDLHPVCPVLKPEAIIATNTSSLSITRLASATDRPERFMGIHFMNPVPVMKLVELVRGIATEETTFKKAREFVASLEKTVTVAEDFPAFIVNRILLPMINEAIYTLYEGVGTVDAIDTAMKLGANHPMGPLQLADFIGLDTCLSIMQVLHDGLADSKYRPCPLLVKYVEAGWLGRKSAAASMIIAVRFRFRRGRFWRWPAEQAEPPHPITFGTFRHRRHLRWEQSVAPSPSPQRGEVPERSEAMRGKRRKERAAGAQSDEPAHSNPKTKTRSPPGSTPWHPRCPRPPARSSPKSGIPCRRSAASPASRTPAPASSAR
jgi:3-hydroxybutyryl-CoA dehydrogenase